MNRQVRIGFIKEMFSDYQKLNPYDHDTITVIRKTLIDIGVHNNEKPDSLIINDLLTAQGKLMSHRKHAKARTE